jgi:hypothetical protein
MDTACIAVAICVALYFAVRLLPAGYLIAGRLLTYLKVFFIASVC